jgi:outer membrane lipoprotein SlyB
MNKLNFLLLFSALFFTQCSKELSSDTYSDDEAGAVKQTYRGVIVNAREVTVKASDKLSDNTLGVIGGGAAGGILGSQIGQGRGSTVGMVLGAIAGAFGGAAAQDKLSTQKGMEYVVELNSGRMITIVQGLDPRLQPGQYVIVMVGNKGRSRVIPDQSY